jgi:hypothetical protein
MIIPGPGYMEELIRARQARLRPTPRMRVEARGAGLRVRVGRALIAVGRSVGGERAELPARPSSSPKPA